MYLTWCPPCRRGCGGWKLIRLFYEGENGAHAYRLYNLKQDVGKMHDLAAAQPQRVKELDALIEKFLTDTKAVTPKPNPDYNANAKAPPVKPKHKPAQNAAARGDERLRLEAAGDAAV